jgi:hypothetical protein
LICTKSEWQQEKAQPIQTLGNPGSQKLITGCIEISREIPCHASLWVMLYTNYPCYFNERENTSVKSIGAVSCPESVMSLPEDLRGLRTQIPSITKAA